MFTVNEAISALSEAGFDIVSMDSPAPNVPSRYRIAIHDEVYFFNEKELIAFAEGHDWGMVNERTYWNP